ncbi:uncharacterized protein FMAN_05220 [Fusarium mangiferae]|uniref:Uncharacterized protein n=1 Tax=Fusarium mangiferae TaxID=192010 RepID=A0A1L7UCS5_FUSMA|nr:uncharacterized protein FMAN_05220 [Fusarium mangiferae]CVL08520.1 uncharacterized protein FMAN_05220 [Fusarium mangiferae]
MKFSTAALTLFLGIALANNTVPMSEDEEIRCQQESSNNGYCCSYADCGFCGFYERCCYKRSGDATDEGHCKCGVNSFPQGTCF